MASPRDLPSWLRTVLNVIAIIGVGATLIGWVQHIIGIIILIAAPLYVAWEIWPWVVRNTWRYSAVSLIVFVTIGGSVGAAVWWTIRAYYGPKLENTQNQPGKDVTTQTHEPTASANPGPTSSSSTQPRESAVTTSIDPISSLSQLGWTVKRDSGMLTFEVMGKPLPTMARSAEYFREIHEPFRLSLQQVPNADGLERIGGINAFQELNLSASDLTGLSQLAGLRSLRKLEITQVPLNTHVEIDSTPLAGLTNLTSLVLNGSRISDLSPATKMPRLERLIIGSTLIRDLSPIRSLRFIKVLDVRDSRISDLSPASGLNQLEELTIDVNQIETLNALSQLPRLQKLTVISQVPGDFTPIGNLAHLTSLFVWGPPFMNLGFLARLRDLTNLQISGFGAPIGPRSRVTGSEFLCAGGKLNTLVLGALQIPSLAFAPQCKLLTEVSLRDIPLTSLDDLTAMQNLKKVSLIDVPVVEVSPLLALQNLESLSLIRVPARADVIAMLERKGVKVTNP